MTCMSRAIVGLLALAVGQTMAVADVFTWQTDGPDNLWRTAGNWEDSSGASGVPGAGDRAVLSDQTNIVIDQDATVDTIEITSSFTVVRVEPGVTLTLENDNVNCSPGAPAPSCPSHDNHTFDGVLRLCWSANNPSSLVLENSHVFGGAHGITSEHSSCTIEIENAETLTNQIIGDSGEIFGALTIKATSGSATFINEGRLVASSPVIGSDDLIDLDSSIEIDDSSDGTWEVAGDDAELIFNSEATDLSGDFIHVINKAGTFRFNENIRTCGSYERLCCDGGFAFGTSKKFEFITYEDGVLDCAAVHEDHNWLQRQLLLHRRCCRYWESGL